MNKTHDIAAEFPNPDSPLYFNSAGATLMPATVRDEVKAFTDALCADNVEAFGKYLPRVGRLRKKLAEMMGATPGEVALTHHTAEATNIIANGLKWNEGDVILTLDHEYPSTVYPWFNLQKRFGVRVMMVEEKDGHADEERIIASIWHHKPRIFAISAVEWCSGWRFDLQKLGRVCREAGCLFFVDSAQALGFTEVDVRSCHISAMAGSAWKWLFGPPGQGYLYLRKGLLNEIQPVFVGSESVVNPQDYSHYHYTLQPDMRRFEYSTSNLSAYAWWDAGVRWLLGQEPDRVRKHVFDLQDYALKGLQDLGCETRGNRDPKRRSGIIAFRHPETDSAKLSKRLAREARVVTKERDGYVRLAFHLYNNREGMDYLLDFLRTEC